MGLEDFTFGFYLCLIATGVGVVSHLIWNYGFKRRSQFNKYNTDQLINNEYIGFTLRLNPNDKWNNFSQRHTSDPFSRMRILPKNPEFYFTEETLNRIKLKNNEEIKDLVYNKK